MKIPCSSFENSFFYIGPGKDFEPLLRFSHLCTNYFFPNLYLSKEEILDYAERFFKDHQDFLEVVSCDIEDDFSEEICFDLHPSYRQHLAAIQFMEHHHRNYRQSFAPAMNEPPWMIHYTLKRKGVDRIIHLYYFTSEGLAAYVALSHNGRYTPRVFCTVETKVLERGTDIVEKMFRQLNSYPMCWIKGYEPDHYGYMSAACFRDYMYPLKTGSIYTELGSDFIFRWEAEGSFVGVEQELDKKSRRFCKAFIRKETAEDISQMTYREYADHGMMVRGSLMHIIRKMHEPDENAMVVLSRNLSRFEQHLPSSVSCVYWEDLMLDYDSDNFLSQYNDLGGGIEKSKYSMGASLYRLDQYLKEQVKDQPDKVFFIPFGLEDEGVVLTDWLSRKKEGPAFIAAVHRPLDFVEGSN